ncbi:MAG: hypothetical protein LUQ07_08590, partial [Methanospirillum sp.]|nr:hypothetical protein [Methanospirillum sp.]
MIKKINLILILTIFFTAACWMAAADRLPQQVPENQVFTLDTLIDATGSMTEESEMEWTIDSG